MLRNQIQFACYLNQISFLKFKRPVTTLSPNRITELLTKDEADISQNALPTSIKSIECNQLASNNPIEDRLRVSLVNLPGSKEPTLILGVFDGHGGETTVDIISRRLFNYIALSLIPNPDKQLKLSKNLNNIVIDLHNSPKPRLDSALQATELTLLSQFEDELLSNNGANIAANLKESFNKCDSDLSDEIQRNLIDSNSSQSSLHYYLSAAVSGCCALVMVIHQGISYLASAGDCRAVLGACISKENTIQDGGLRAGFNVTELNDEHNCDNINEVRRLAASHPKSEQNTMIRHNRLLGHLMPFRAFGDYNYKWSAEVIRACGITRAFGTGVIPSNYKTPPYLIADPDIREINMNEVIGSDKYIVIASDGLWELFESSRDVMETIFDQENELDHDKNRATHILRSALRSGSNQDFGMDREELRRLYHIRLESTLTLPHTVSRNFRDDISIIVLKLQ